MDARSETAATKNETTRERKSDRELVFKRTFNAPARIVFETWTNPELFQRWWVPKSFPIVMRACDMDVRVGGKYRLSFGMRGKDEEPAMDFFGKYLEVTPHSRLVWTNEEAGMEQITTVTFEEKGGKTYVAMHDLYPSKEALEEALGSGSEDCKGETFDQLDDVLVTPR